MRQQLAVPRDALARRAGLLPRVAIFNFGEHENYRVPDGGPARLL